MREAPPPSIQFKDGDEVENKPRLVGARAAPPPKRVAINDKEFMGVRAAPPPKRINDKEFKSKTVSRYSKMERKTNQLKGVREAPPPRKKKRRLLKGKATTTRSSKR